MLEFGSSPRTVSRYMTERRAYRRAQLRRLRFIIAGVGLTDAAAGAVGGAVAIAPHQPSAVALVALLGAFALVVTAVGIASLGVLED